MGQIAKLLGQLLHISGTICIVSVTDSYLTGPPSQVELHHYWNNYYTLVEQFVSLVEQIATLLNLHLRLNCRITGIVITH